MINYRSVKKFFQEREKEIIQQVEEKNTSINEVMDIFNFEKVQRMMKLVNWVWANSDNRVPETYELKEVARKLLEEAYSSIKKEEYSVSTGGLKATAFKNEEGKTKLILEFVFEEAGNW